MVGNVIAVASGQAVSPSPAAGPCNCADLPAAQHRLEELQALQTLLQDKLQATNSSEPATRQLWAALHQEIRSYIPSLRYQHAPTPGNIAMFNSILDPACGAQGASNGACMDQAWAAHQRVHEQSCRAGRWSGQSLWTARAMFQEELDANQAEIDFLNAEIARLLCECPRFVIRVQVVTTTQVSMSAITEKSARSLNGMQGIPVPIVLHEDGTFDGFGRGSDAGRVDARGGPDTAKGQFGRQVFIHAYGKIQPGDCTTKPCKPDMMHLVLAGAAGPQTVTGKATAGPLTMNLDQKTPGGAAIVELDLPAYVGSVGEKIFLAAGLINSKMTVVIQGADSSQPGAQATDAGASLLYTALECRLAKVPPPVLKAGGPPSSGTGSGGSGGGASGGGTGGSGSGAGGSGDKHSVNIIVKEWVHIPELVYPPPIINVSETIHTTETILLPVQINVTETIHATETVLPPVQINVTETIHALETVQP